MDTHKAASPRATDTDGNLLLLLTALLYGLLTLLPDSSTQVVTWPWVALWQGLLLLPLLWLLWQVWHKPLGRFRLGHGLDWVAGLFVVALVVSTLAAEFPQPARWYSWAAIGGLAALYGLVGWLTPERARLVLKAQAGLALVFILLSLFLWVTNTYLPELSRLDTLRSLGLSPTFNFGILGLRNGYPLGHQNYVAGYLVLVLPLLAGLAIAERAGQRWLWGSAVVLGLVDLYTTSSRGGVLALVALGLPLLLALLLSPRLPRRIVLPGSLIGLVALGLLVLTNPRLQVNLAALGAGNAGGGQVAYRLITNTVGWQMGLERPWAGLGLGSVPLVYQRYHPVWGGREAELHHQLHSTPAQLWGELGLWGVALPLVAAALLALALGRSRSCQTPLALPAPLLWSLVSALWAFSVMGLTDYQLDVIAIGGVLVVYLAVLLFTLRPPSAEAPATPDSSRRRRVLVGGGLGLVLAMGLWLLPIHRAWAASLRGFILLGKEDLQGFVTQLQTAQQLAPWESYYPFQRGWVLGDLSFKTNDSQVTEQVRSEAIAAFQAANLVSPYQEFGHSNLGWLLAGDEPTAAIAEFAQSAQLLPAKTGVFFGLGYSLMLAGQSELAAEAMALEIARHPLVLTSPVWEIGQFATLYPAVLNRLETLYSDLLARTDDPALQALLHQNRGTLRWWTNDLTGAAADWQQAGNPTSLAILAAAQGQTPDLDALPAGSSKSALQAWYDAENRQRLLAIAWLTQSGAHPIPHGTPPQDLLDELAITMAASDSLEQWLKETAPSVELRNERLGFGVFNRHDDGPNPVDYYLRIENLPLASFFQDLVPSPIFMPALDEALQPEREAVVEGSLELGVGSTLREGQSPTEFGIRNSLREGQSPRKLPETGFLNLLASDS